jgi:predicted heme/steroid binding protein
MRTFSEDELKKYDGRNSPAYIAYRGKVYDVSASYHWRNGIHHATHRAGCDLTGALEQAPHDAALLHKFLIVGDFVK